MNLCFVVCCLPNVGLYAILKENFKSANKYNIILKLTFITGE